MSREIEALISAEMWSEARALILAALEPSAENHWLLARLALTYYEQRRYGEALNVARQAEQLSPRCPLVLWELGGALDMLGRSEEAIRIYKQITRRGVRRIAVGECGEGTARARGLVADCWYRVARCYSRTGHAKLSSEAYVRHLRMRGSGCRSIYPIAKVRRELRCVRTAQPAAAADERQR